MCLEPGPTDTNILNTVRENIEFVDMFGSSAFKIQMDAKAMAENNELDLDVFRLAKPLLVHYHVNDLGLGALGNSWRSRP